MRLWDPGRAAATRNKLLLYARLIRVEHTLFSLPFAAIGLLVARAYNVLVYILAFLSLFGLRSAAMIFNNLADADVDALNPRTASRPLVRGLVGVREALVLLILSTIVYYLAAYAICWAALLYATPLYILALLYPYAKRVHSVPHMHLGLVLGMAVFGGWVAGACSRGVCDPLVLLISAPWLIVLGVALWVAGFDTVYSLMDYDVDVRLGLGSLPARLGPRRALKAAFAMEVASTILWCLGGLLYAGVYAAASSLAAGLVATLSVVSAMRSEESIPRAFNANLAVGFIALAGYVAQMVAYAGV